MSASDVWSLVAVVVLIVATAVVGAAETVLTRLPLVRALRLDEEERAGAPQLLWSLEHRSRALGVLLLVTLVLRTGAAALLAVVAWRELGGVAGVVLGAVGFVLVSFTAAEAAPRTLVLRHLDAAGLRLGPPVALLTRALHPVTQPLVDLGRWLVRVRGEVSGPYAPDEELRELVTDDEDEELEEDERAMIHSIFELGDTVVREIMVPRPDMVTVGEDDRLEVVIDAFVRRGYSRLPVYAAGDRDEIVGVVYAKDVLERLARDPDEAADWSALIRPATYVPETKRADDLLRELQESKVHLAIVVDEYGGMSGLVTIEDILEEIVGEIVDEHDHEEPLVEVLGDDRLRVDARLPVDDLNELTGSELPDEDWDTVGGLVLGVLGHVPRPGDQVNIDGLTLVAERVQGRRISKVLVVRRPVAPAEHDAPRAATDA